MPDYLPRVLLSLVAAMTLSAHADDALIEAGAELYADYCANCHGDGRDGIEKFTDDVDGFNDRLAGITEEMPDFTDFFEEDEIAAMYAYLSATNENE